jgi:hypothetical protein
VCLDSPIQVAANDVHDYSVVFVWPMTKTDRPEHLNKPEFAGARAGPPPKPRLRNSRPAPPGLCGRSKVTAGHSEPSGALAIPLPIKETARPSAGRPSRNGNGNDSSN